MREREIAGSVRSILVLTGVLLATGLAVASEGEGPEGPEGSVKRVVAAHELLDADAKVDENGLFVPVPVSHPGRRYPATDDYPTGPAVGDRLPDFVLTDQFGNEVDFHQSRQGQRAALIFHRSAVW